MKNNLVLGVSAALLIVVLSWTTTPANTGRAGDQKPLVVFCVRHGEKVDTSADPELAPDGEKRAKRLALTLRNAGIEYVHSSDYKRTRNTAKPFAVDKRLETQLYNPRDLPKLVDKLREKGGRHLVVGHSNTTPKLVKLLGGEPGTEIDEPHEYDRLYVVTIGKDGSAQSVLLRFGKPYSAED